MQVFIIVKSTNAVLYRVSIAEDARVNSLIETLEVVNIKEEETVTCSFVPGTNPDGMSCLIRTVKKLITNCSYSHFLCKCKSKFELPWHKCICS